MLSYLVIFEDEQDRLYRVDNFMEMIKQLENKHPIAIIDLEYRTSVREALQYDLDDILEDIGYVK
jgi:hypothetical protein